MNERYAVVDLSGKRGPWRDVSAYTAALRDGWHHRQDALGDAHRRNLQDGTFKAQVRKPKTTGSVLQAKFWSGCGQIGVKVLLGKVGSTTALRPCEFHAAYLRQHC